MGIVDEDIVRVRENTDIVKVITEHVALRKVGQRWQGLCPFHQENSPSFSVNAQQGLYYCFGCQARGDAITFVREIEGLDFAAAVEKLAAKAGISLRYTTRNEGAARQKRSRLVELVGAAVAYYHRRLLESPDAGPARAYLRERGIDGDEARRYQLGWAPDEWDALATSLRAADRDLTDAGLGFTNRRGRVQDQFRARILFPIFDVQGDPVGFGGRKLPGTEGAKYKNSPDSAIYNKSRLLWNLHRVKEQVVRTGEIIVCEGYTDVMAFDRVGVPRAVATCGTALTEEHVKLLQRFANRVVLAFDADGAGQAAAERFHEWEQAYGLDVRVAALPPGVDPGELAQQDPDALRASVADPRPFLEFRVERALAAGDLSTAEGRARAAEAALDLVRAHPNALVRDQYVMTVADRCGLDPEMLRRTLAAPRRTPEPERQGRSDRGGADAARQPPADRPVAAAPALADDAAEFQMLRLAIDKPEFVPALVDERLFLDPIAGQAFVALLERPELHDAIAGASPEVAGLLHRAAVADSDIADERGGQRLGGIMVDAVATRYLHDLHEAARRTGDLRLGRTIADLQNHLATLRDGGWQIADAERLLWWLEAEAEDADS